MSSNIFINSKKPLYNKKNNVININFTESEVGLNQNGGNLKTIDVTFSTTEPIRNPRILKGGSLDTSEYFNNIANKFISKQNGGFNINTKIQSNSESDIFLSSETINDIKNVQSGGGSKHFNFNSLKNHLSRAIQLDGGSESSIQSMDKNKNKNKKNDSDSDFDNDSDEDDSLFDDEDDDDEDETDKLDGKVLKMVDIPVKTPVVSRSKSKHSKSESDSIFLNSSLSDTSEQLSQTSKDESESHNYELSLSVSTPQLMSYRNVNKNTVISGKRYT